RPGEPLDQTDGTEAFTNSHPAAPEGKPGLPEGSRRVEFRRPHLLVGAHQAALARPPSLCIWVRLIVRQLAYAALGFHEPAEQFHPSHPDPSVVLPEAVAVIRGHQIAQPAHVER